MLLSFLAVFQPTSTPASLSPHPFYRVPAAYQVDEVVETLGELGAKLPAHPDQAERAKLAEAYVKEGFFKKAVTHLESIAARKPNATYFFGDSLTIADLSLVAAYQSCVSGYFAGQPKEIYHEYTNLLRIINNTLQHPSVIPHLLPQLRPKIKLT